MAIDDKVVAMSFENSRFESGVRTTINSLDKLKQSLQFTGASKGLTDLGTSVNSLGSSFRPLNKNVDSVRAHFSALNVAASAIIGHIAIQLTNMAERAIKAFTIGPIIQGLGIYQTKLQAIQTILANTQAAGTKMSQVTAALQELNVYSNKTIYAFGEMTRNIGTFTAAGVGLKPAVAAIKGIANLAALSGSNSQQAATAMYQLSQAIGSGRVSLQDWNSVVNAGLGGTVFQRALAQTAVAMGQIPKSALKLVGPMKNVSIHGESFRQSMQARGGKQTWLTSDVLTKTLATFTGDLTDAQLAAEGFNKAQIKAIQAQAQVAVKAATQVKTFSQLIDVLKETIATGFARSFELVIGNLDQAKKLFTGISDSVSGVINSSAKARNKILGDWKSLGGRAALIDSLKNVFQAFGAVLKPIHDAFRDIFPRKTGQQLYDLTERFDRFTKTLKPSPATVELLRRTFAGLFAVIDIGKQIVFGIIGVISKLFGTITHGSGSFLTITAKIGDFFVALDLAIRKGTGLRKFFTGLAAVLTVPIKLFQYITQAISNMFAGFSPGKFSVHMDGATKAAQPFKKVLDVIIQTLQGLGPAINNAISNINFEAILAVIRTGLLAAIVLMMRRFIGGTTLEKTLGLFGSKLGRGFARNLGGGLLGNLSKAFGGLTGSLTAMQNALRAKTLEEIAISIALLAASVVALSLVKPKRINASLGAMAIAFGELIGAMVILNKSITTAGAAKLVLIGVAMIELATAIDILTVAVLIMGKLSWSELTKGLLGIGGVLVAIAIGMKLMPKGLIVTSTSILILSVALNALGLAVRQFGSMDLVTLGKGLGAIAGVLVAIAIGMKLMPKGLIVTSTSMLILSVAINALGLAVRQFGSMNLETLGKGLLGIGGALVAIAVGMKLMPKGLIFTSTSMVILSVALNGFALALKQMGGMSIGEIARSLITLAGSLTILALAMKYIQTSVFGAAALLLMATSIGILAVSLTALARLSIKQIVTSLIALAATFVIIGTAASLAAESIPALLGFGAALVLIGGGLALAGVGVALIGVGLSAIVIAGPTAIGILIQSLIDLSKAIGEIGQNVLLGLLEIVKTFSKVAPQFVEAIVKIINTMTDAVIKSAPKLAEALVVLVKDALQALARHAPAIIQAGFDILIALLQGINNNIDKVTTMAATIIVNFINSLAKNMNRLVSAGYTFVISIIQGIANNIDRVITAGANIIIKFVKGITNNLTRIVTAGGKAIAHFLTGIGNSLSEIVTAGGNAIAHFLTGIGNAGPKIITAGTTAIIKLINAIQRNNNRLVNAGFKAIIRFLNGIANAIDKHEPELIHAGFRIGKAIVTGMLKGLTFGAPGVISKAKDIAGSALHKIGSVLGIGSPSKETYKIGRFVVQGLVNGISNTAPDAYIAAGNMSKGVLKTFNDVFQTASPSKVMKQIGKYVGQGFAQGLQGSQTDINTAFTTLNDKLVQAMKTARQTITTERDKLKKLRAADKPDEKAIAAAQKTIAQNQATLAKAIAAHKALTGTLRDQKKELSGLAKDYEKLGTKLQAAQGILSQAIQQKNQAVQSLKQQYGALPSITSQDAQGNSVDSLEAYKSSIQYQIKAIKHYNQTLQKLKKMGLDKETYQKLLQEGTPDQSFADQLVSSGKKGIHDLNSLDKNLGGASKQLAVNAGNNLYQAGINAAQGLVDGLKAKHNDIRKQMESIANEVVGALKRKLRIKSPSEVFADIARLSMEGLAQGFIDSSSRVNANIEQVADSALTTLQKKMQNISTLANGEINLDPTITPILDLTQVRGQAKKMSALMSTDPIAAKVSLDQAYSISSTQQPGAKVEQTVPVAHETSIKLEQNNYSPRALSPLEIYRRTKNQLSQLRSVADPVLGGLSSVK